MERLETRQEQFSVIKSVLENLDATQVRLEDIQVDPKEQLDYKALWNTVFRTLIAETAKDFTIMMNFTFVEGNNIESLSHIAGEEIQIEKYSE